MGIQPAGCKADENRVTLGSRSPLLCSTAMSATPPEVTAILLSHNCEQVIGAALQSVLAQDCEPMEIIVSDDASTDATYAAIVAEFRADDTVNAVYSDYAFMEEGDRAGARRGVRHPPPGTSAGQWFARVDAFASGATLAIRRDVAET